MKASGGKGSTSRHGVNKAVYPKAKASGTSVRIKKPSTKGSGLKAVKGRRAQH